MTHELYEKKIPVCIKASEQLQERKTHVHIVVKSVNVSSTPSRKELVIRLTDDSDYFFLYYMRLSEDDFKSLKVQLGLLVDFSAFPRQMITLFDQCLNEEHKLEPKFILELVCNGSSLYGPASLNIIETNSFRFLTHLSLKFSPGNDEEIKQHLAETLRASKEQNAQLQERMDQTENDLRTQLRQTREALASRTDELANVKPEFNSKLSELVNKHSVELGREREKLAQIQSSLQQKCDDTRQELITSHQKIVGQLESKLQQLEKTFKEVSDAKYQAESTVRELRIRLSGVEEENSRLRKELESMRRDSANSGSDRYELEKTISQLKTRVAVLEQEIKDKEDVLISTKNFLDSEKAVKKRHEEELDRRKRQIGQLDAVSKNISAELVKANEIIRKLQGEIKSYHTKLKVRTQVTNEQEKCIGEKQREIEELKKEMEGVKNALTQKTDENSKLNESLEANVQKLEESKQLLRTNENVISWLNKQITEAQIGTQRPTAYNPSITPIDPTGSVRPTSFTPTLSNGFGYPSSTSTLRFSSTEPSPFSLNSIRPNNQVQYQAMSSRPSMVPVPMNRSTPYNIGNNMGGPVPNVQRRSTGAGGEGGLGVLNSSPILLNNSSPGTRDQTLDPKYLQKTPEGLATNRPVLKEFNISGGPVPSQTLGDGSPLGPTRLYQGLAPQPTPGGAQPPLDNINRNNIRQSLQQPPPLASAYFPSKVS